MSIVERTLNRFGFISQAQFENRIAEAVKRELDKVPRWLGETADAERQQPDPFIYANQADLYRLSPILGTALDVLADDVGLTKFNVKRMVGEETRDIPNHEFEILMRNPNPLDTGMEFLGSTTKGYKLNGNHIWWLNRASKYEPPMEIWEIPYQFVKPVPDGNLYLAGYDYFPGNAKSPIRLPVWQIVHFKTYNPTNRFAGLSPIESLAETIIGDLGMRKTDKTIYTTYQGMPPSILAFKDWVPDEAWKDIKAEKQRAAMKNEMMMLRGVGDSVTWMSRAMSSRDSEFIEKLKHNMVDVFNRMCPGLLAMLSENATEANALAARATYSEKTLWKTLEVIAQKITSDILPVYGRKLFGIFDDPRVVDRKLQLSEQEAFERTHTIEETRKEYYQDDPIGDERDELFVSQVNAQSGGIQKPPPPPKPPMPPGTDTQPAEETPLTDTSGEDVQAKAAIADLLIWRRMALRGKTEKAQAFKSQAIPAEVMKDITRKLAILTEKPAIAALFDAKIDSFKPKPKIDQAAAANILDSMRIGLEALKLQREQRGQESRMLEAIKSLVDNRQPYVIMPPAVNIAPGEFHAHIPESVPPLTNVYLSPTIEPGKPASVTIDNPVNIYQQVEPAALPTMQTTIINEAQEAPAPPVTNVSIENRIPESVPPLTNVYIENKPAEQPAPVTNVSIENILPDQPTPEISVKNEFMLPDQPPPQIIVQPSTAEVRVEPQINFNPTIEPAKVENNIEVKTPKAKRERQKVKRDVNGDIEGTETEIDYEE